MLMTAAGSAGICTNASPDATGAPNTAEMPTSPSGPTVATSTTLPSSMTLVMEHTLRPGKYTSANGLAVLVKHLPYF